jgi:SpoVK/Ycf46/Vps4 family AAA+-type ATPase
MAINDLDLTDVMKERDMKGKIAALEGKLRRASNRREAIDIMQEINQIKNKFAYQYNAPQMMSPDSIRNFTSGSWSVSFDTPKVDPLVEAQEKIKELTGILEQIQKEPTILYRIERLSKDRKFCYVKKQDTELRVEAVKNLMEGDEVLLHPKTFQIVEHLGRPPLEVSKFSPANPPNVTWDDIGGLEEAKRDMIEAIEMPHKYKELFKAYHKRPIKGILLSGPPGCGKTMLGKAAATCLSTIYGKESARTGFLYVKGPEILNMYVGATEAAIRDLFFDAERHAEENGYPAVIFIDEADAILAERGSRTVGIGNTIVPAFLTEMDGLESSSAIVILATNRPDVLDPAIVRDGRIDRKISVTRPTLQSATDILRMSLKNVPLESAFTLETLAEDLAQAIYSDELYVTDDKLLRDVVNGAMLAGVVDLAVSTAIHRDIDAGKRTKSTGLNDKDCLVAINRMVRMTKDLKHDMQEAA